MPQALGRVHGGRGGGESSEANVFGCFLLDQQLNNSVINISEIIDNSVAILLTYDTARVHVAGRRAASTRWKTHLREGARLRR